MNSTALALPIASSETLVLKVTGFGKAASNLSILTLCQEALHRQ